MSAGATPGPWAVNDTHPQRACLYIGSRGNVYDVATVYLSGNETTHAANAKLIAAAPSLADRLEARACCAVECEDPCDACRADREVLRAAGRLP